MTANRRSRYCRGSFVLPLILLTTVSGFGRAEDPDDSGAGRLFPSDFRFDPVLAMPSTPAPRSNRIPLFRIAPAFLTEPIGLDLDDPLPTDPDLPPEADEGPNWLKVAFGGDNPFLDLRRRGDPGGVGYYRLHSQVQLVDSPTTGFAFALKAVTPAGRDANGVAGGPTYCSPALSYFQSLDDNFAFQAFVGKKMRLEMRGQGPFGHAVESGVGLNRMLTDGTEGQGRLYVFVEALGRYQFDDTIQKKPAMEMVPGLHWRIDENWWMSGGWVVPMSARPEVGQWQITCWIQF